VWVDQGCEATFIVGGYADSDSDGRTITCRSRNFEYEHCRANVRGAVRLEKQLSDTACIRGRTWGYDRHGIWVDQGCSGRFVIGYSGGDDDYRPGDWPWPFGDEAPSGRRVRCESRGFGYHHCPAETGGRVRLSEQISEAPCVRGRTWGYDRSGIWVDQGCAAEFIVGRWRDRD
jgi:hypothetical protein